MPKETSHYAPRVLDKTLGLGYSGMFLVDADNGDIVRLELRSDPPPAETGLTGIVQTLDYSRANIAGASVFVPVSSRLTLQESGASEIGIAIKYENCHRHFANAGAISLRV